MSSRGVFVSLRELVIGCYNMYDVICKEFSHTTIISRTRSQLSGTDSAAHGLQAARQLRSKSQSFRRKMRRAGRLVMCATVCGHHVRQRNDEKLADLRSDDPHIVGQKLLPPKQRASAFRSPDVRGNASPQTI